MTYGELVFIVKDILKIISDDAIFEDEHIIFLSGRFRNLLIKKYYDTPKKSIPQSVYQTICLDLTYSDNPDICGVDNYLMSVQKIPNVMSIGNNSVYPLNYFIGNIEFINKDRFRYAGKNKYLKNIIFATLGPDSHLYLKSANKNFLNLEKVRMTAIFEDFDKVRPLLCDNDGCGISDILEIDFPIEDALIPELIEMLIKELSVGIYHPQDNQNNAKDDLSDITQFIRQNMKDRYLKQYGGD